MTKPFNIHDWQAKQAKKRLEENDDAYQQRQNDQKPGTNTPHFYDDDSIFGKLKKDPDFIKKLNAKNAKKEHHNKKNFPGKDLSAWDLLDKIKDGDKGLYKSVEAFMKSMNEMNSLTSSGNGATVTPRNSMDFSTPNAFGDDKDKKMKTYKSIGYKKVKK
tara:strand:+ start:264 stop:743 length:480 start_codon:yes stop_codon:yes gene_type:complete